MRPPRPPLLTGCWRDRDDNGQLTADPANVYSLYIPTWRSYADQGSEVGQQPRIADSKVTRGRGPGGGGGDRRSVGRRRSAPGSPTPSAEVRFECPAQEGQPAEAAWRGLDG